MRRQGARVKGRNVHLDGRDVIKNISDPCDITKG